MIVKCVGEINLIEMMKSKKVKDRIFDKKKVLAGLVNRHKVMKCKKVRD